MSFIANSNPHERIVADEPVRVSAEEGLELLLDDAESQNVATNQWIVRRAARITDAIEHATAHPWVYAGSGRDASETAERAAVFEIAARLHLPEPQVLGIATVVRAARGELPQLWASARDGFAPFATVEFATTARVQLLPPLDCDDAAREASAAALVIFDTKVTAFAMHLSLAAFRARVRRLIEQLSAQLGIEVAARRHAIAMTERRVVIEPAGDGMAWMSAFIPLIQAVAIKRRLTSTAKHRQKNARHGRTRDQLRADLFCEWLTGEGTATAAKIKLFVTVPLDVLAGERPPGYSRTRNDQAKHKGAEHGDAAHGVTAHFAQAELVGHGPIDSATARQLFFDAQAFHRVATDPISGVMLDLDRRTYRPTTAQRDWLILAHGTCSRDGCTRLALDADIDHQMEWARGGKTDIANLAPLCPPDHLARHRSRLSFRRRDNGTVEVTSPTGFRSTEPPPF